MKKNAFSIVLSLLMICLIIPVRPVYSLFDSTTVSLSEKMNNALMTIEQIEFLEQKSVSIMNQTVLFDISDEPSYILSTFSEGGYAISNINGVIAIYDLDTKIVPFSEIKDKQKKIFAGPLMYFIEETPSSLKRIDANTIIDKSSIKKGDIEQNSIYVNLVVENSNSLVPETGTEKMLATSGVITGLPETRFARYSSGKWINSSSNYPPSQGYPSGGICGTIASAVMLDYLDVYVQNTTVPDFIKLASDSTPGYLITSLYPMIDKGKNGTIPLDLSNGIENWAMLVQSGILTTELSMTTTFSLAKKYINLGRPIAIGLLTMLGSTYGDHWVTVYKYQDNGIYPFYTSYYWAVDNHGSYTARINVNWTAGAVGVKY
jgi:hypothetical protein